MRNDYAEQRFLKGQKVVERKKMGRPQYRLEGDPKTYLAKTVIPRLEQAVKQAQKSLDLARQQLGQLTPSMVS